MKDSLFAKIEDKYLAKSIDFATENIDRVRLRGNVSAFTETQLGVLEKIKDVLATPRKYDTVVKCLYPVWQLTSSKVQHVNA